MADLKAALVLGFQDLITGGLGKVETKIQELEGRAKELDNTLKTLKGFKEVSQKLEEFEAKEGRLTTQTAKLRASKARLENRLKELTKSFKEGKISQHEYLQKSRELQREILQTENRLQSLEAELRQVKTQKSKLISESAKLKQELQKLGIEVSQVDKKIEEYEKELRKLNQTTEKASKLSEALKSGLSALLGAGLVAGITTELFGLEKAVRSVIAQTAVFDTSTRENFEKVKQKLKKDIFEIKKATGASFSEIEEKLTELIHGLGRYDESVKKAVITALQLEKITKGRLEGQELTRALTQASKNFGISTQEAVNYIFAVYQKVGDKAGDLLDTFWEYSDALRDAGISAKEFSAILIAGAQAGAFNFDKIGDILKGGFKASLAEASTLQELLGNIEQNQKGLIDTLLGEGSKQWIELKSAFIDYVQAVKSGNKELAKSSFAKIAGLLAEAYKKDATKTKELIQKVFGTIGAEDVGIQVLEAISKALTNPEDFLKGIKDVQKAYEEALSPIERFQIALTSTFTQISQAARPFFDILTTGLENVSKFIQEHQKLASALITGVAIFTPAGIAIKGLGMAYPFVKGTISALLSPLRLFRKETQETCRTGVCVNKLSKSFGLLGERMKSLRSVKGLLGKALRFGLKGLKLGRFLLGFGGPIGLALTGASLIPDLYNFVKNSELGRKLITGVKDIGGSMISGFKKLLGFGEKETTKKEVREFVKESTLSVALETAKEKIVEKGESKIANITVNITISNLTALNPEEIAERIKALLVPEVKKAIEREIYMGGSVY